MFILNYRALQQKEFVPSVGMFKLQGIIRGCVTLAHHTKNYDSHVYLNVEQIESEKVNDVFFNVKRIFYDYCIQDKTI